MQRNSSPQRNRNGTATLELVVCLPILLMVIVGTVEACGIIYLKQSLCVAAYEGARKSVAHSSSKDEVVQRCHKILRQRQVLGAQVEITPDDFELKPEQTWITVRVTARTDLNTYIGSLFSQQLIVGAEATMMKE